MAQEAILRGEERKTRRRATLKNRLEQSRESRFNEYLPTFDKAPESKLWAIGPYRLLFRFAPTTILLLEIASLANPGARKAYSGYFAAVIAAKAASLVYIQAGLNHCFKKHGADAFILLSVKPPKKHRVERIWFWERQMIRQGYLSKEGGLTRKGVELVRELQPREVILERVNRWKAVQEVMLEREKAQKEKALE
ncbi:MAG: hypothetical protein NT067_03125 [Candidatus Diapherotrites archaeon]|nr:hypothetical protein [Candidatus Diapherotrites archaeon]